MSTNHKDYINKSIYRNLIKKAWVIRAKKLDDNAREKQKIIENEENERKLLWKNEQNNFDKFGKSVIDDIANKISNDINSENFEISIRNELLLTKNDKGCSAIRNYINNVIDNDNYDISDKFDYGKDNYCSIYIKRNIRLNDYY